jgi:transposase
VTVPAPSTPSVDQLLARIAELEQRLPELEVLVSSQAAEVARLLALLGEREAELAVLRSGPGSGKNSQNSSVPPSQSFKANRPAPAGERRKRGARKGHRGVSRFRGEPNRVLPCPPQTCHQCGRDLTGVRGHERGRSQLIELPPVRPEVIEAVRYRCTCPDCGAKSTGSYPAGWDPRQTFGPRLQTLLAYLHHQQHIGYQRLCRMLWDLWEVRISEGALANSLARTATRLKPAYEAIRDVVRGSRVVGSDESPQRVDGRTCWDWVVQSAAAVYHFIAKSRAAKELEQFYDGRLPEVQECDLFSSQLASPVPRKAVCQAHQLRDLRYAQEHGDREYAPNMSRLIRMAIGLSHRRDHLSANLFAHQAARIQRLGHQLGWGPLAKNPFGEAQQQRFRRHESGWWLFLERADVSPTNNASERAVRAAVVHRKVLGGFRSDWGADAYAMFLSVAQTGQREQVGVFEAIARILLSDATIALAPQPDG